MTQALSAVARTPLHHWHAAHDAVFAQRDGWQVVAQYANQEHEMEARSNLALADISATAKLSLRGKGVLAAAQGLGGAAAAPRGVSLLHGGILACRLTDEHLMLLASNSSISLVELQQCCGGPRLVWDDVTSAYAGFLVVGSRTDDLLRRLTPLDIRPGAFPANSCAETSVAGVEALLMRWAEPAISFLRIYVSWDLAEYVWTRIMEAGEELQIAPMGVVALAGLGTKSA